MGNVGKLKYSVIEGKSLTVDLSVVLSTYNRREYLQRALASLSRQITHDISYEVIVVDNNSTDSTKALILSYVAADARFRYLFEPRQGISHARNAGILAAAGGLIVFTDDDIEFEPTWIEENYKAALRYPEADYFGGRILPIWPGPAPSWIRLSMDPFALSDLGPEPLRISPALPCCLVGASLAVRRRALDKAGLFSTATQRVKNGIGSTEDWDWEVKVWECGGHGMYVPEILCRTQVPRERLRRSYHRRWHAGNGKFHAISRKPELQGSNRLLDVPLFVYRYAGQTAGLALWSWLTRQELAFAHELKLCYYFGFIRQHWASCLRNSLRKQAQAGYRSPRQTRSADLSAE